MSFPTAKAQRVAFGSSEGGRLCVPEASPRLRPELWVAWSQGRAESFSSASFAALSLGPSPETPGDRTRGSWCFGLGLLCGPLRDAFGLLCPWAQPEAFTEHSCTRAFSWVWARAVALAWEGRRVATVSLASRPLEVGQARKMRPKATCRLGQLSGPAVTSVHHTSRCPPCSGSRALHLLPALEAHASHLDRHGSLRGPQEHWNSLQLRGADLVPEEPS